MHHFTNTDRAARIADLVDRRTFAEETLDDLRRQLWTCTDPAQAVDLRARYDAARDEWQRIEVEITLSEGCEATATHCTPRGRLVGLDVSKAGGGTVGRRYAGRWLYRAVDLESGEVLMSGGDLYAGLPIDHAGAADLLRVFLDEAEDLSGVGPAGYGVDQ